MTETATFDPTSGLCLPGTALAFVPVLRTRMRHGGWTPDIQARFIVALDTMGSVGRAARAVGMSRNSAYRLREAAGADSFVAAWDHAVHHGRLDQWFAAMDRAINGVTQVRILAQGRVSVTNSIDSDLTYAALRPHPPRAKPSDDTKSGLRLQR